MVFQQMDPSQNHQFRVGSNSGRNYPPDKIRGVPFAKEPIRKAIHVLNGSRETINQLALIGSFIAAVQAQMVVITFGNNEKSNQRAINAFAFAGLMLDVIGTSIGLINGVLFQKRVLQLMNLQAKMEEMPKVLMRIQSLEDEFLHTPNSAALTTITEELEKLWKGEQIRVIEFNSLTPLMQKAESNVRQDRVTDHAERLFLEFNLKNIVSLLKQSVLQVFLFANPISNAASSATFSILAGVLCFISGVCIFVIDSQPFVVSFTTVFVLCSVSLACCVPLILLPVTDLANRLMNKAFPKALSRVKSSNSLLMRIFDAYGVVIPYNNQAIQTELLWLTQQIDGVEQL